MKINKNDTVFGFNIEKEVLSTEYGHDKVLRNLVDPRLGEYVFNKAFKEKQVTLI